MNISEKQKQELRLIVNNPASYGSFSGMIANQSLDSGATIEYLIIRALDIRIKLKEMIK